MKSISFSADFVAKPSFLCCCCCCDFTIIIKAVTPFKRESTYRSRSRNKVLSIVLSRHGRCPLPLLCVVCVEFSLDLWLLILYWYWYAEISVDTLVKRSWRQDGATYLNRDIYRLLQAAAEPRLCAMMDGLDSGSFAWDN